MIFHIAVCSPDPVLRGRVQRHCMEYYARRADACIVEQLESTAALLRQEEAGRAAQYDPLREKLNQMLNVKYCVDTASREREPRNREKQMDQPQH